MENSKKNILWAYSLNAISIFLPIAAYFILFAMVKMSPGTASDKAGMGFLIIFSMIPVLVITGIIFLFSTILTFHVKNTYLYILSLIVIIHYVFAGVSIWMGSLNFFAFSIFLCSVIYIAFSYVFFRNLAFS